MRRLEDIYGLEFEDARRIVERARWEEGVPRCPRCGSLESYDLSTRSKYNCKRCDCHYTAFTGTTYGRAKLSFKQLLVCAFLFARARKGISSLNLSALMGVQQRTAWRICHIFRSGLVEELGKIRLGGVVEIDGATFGGHMRWENDGLTGRKHVKRLNQRCIVVVAKQRLGRTVPMVVTKESEAKERLIEIIEPGAVIVADQARGWDSLKELYELLRVNHTYTFGSNSTACTNNAESFFSGLRKMHDGTHHWMSVKYMPGYACELAWKRDAKERGMSDQALTEELLTASFRHMPSYVGSAGNALRVA